MNLLSDKIELSILLEVYGDLLTDRQHELMKSYIDLDVSLSELAEMSKVSRQAVRDGIVKAEKALREYESKLGFVAMRKRISDIALRAGKGCGSEAAISEIAELVRL